MTGDTPAETLHAMFSRFLSAYEAKPAELATTYGQFTQLFLMMATMNFNRVDKGGQAQADAEPRDKLQRIFADAMDQGKGLHFLITRGISALNFMPSTPLAGPSLDLGCGDGYSSSLIFDAPFTYGIDLTEAEREPVKRHGRHKEYLVGSADAIPLPDASVETVVMSNVLYHVANRDAVLTEVKRVLRPGGSVMFDDTTPDVFDTQNRPFLAFLKALGGADYTSLYNRARHTLYMEGRTINPLVQLVCPEYPAYLRRLGFDNVHCKATMSSRVFKLAYAFHDVEYLMGAGMPSPSGRVRNWVLSDLVEILIRDRDLCTAIGGCYTFCSARKPLRG